MARVKRGVTGHAKHKKVLKAAKGYYGRRKNTIRIAKQAVEKANQYAYRDRKRRKRTFRALWIQRLNAAVRPFGLTYSRFIDGLGKAGVAGRPQGAVRPRDPRAGGVPGDRREGQGRAAGAAAQAWQRDRAIPGHDCAGVAERRCRRTRCVRAPVETSMQDLKAELLRGLWYVGARAAPSCRPAAWSHKTRARRAGADRPRARGHGRSRCATSARIAASRCTTATSTARPSPAAITAGAST